MCVWIDDYDDAGVEEVVVVPTTTWTRGPVPLGRMWAWTPMVAISWTKSLHAYGMSTLRTSVTVLFPEWDDASRRCRTRVHAMQCDTPCSGLCGMMLPHAAQMPTVKSSERRRKLSRR